MKIPLPAHIRFIIEKFYSNGYEAYAVGGCVRNGILNLPAKDYDITTSAEPAQIKELFSDFRCIETGIKHGTVTVIVDNISVEITTYRTECGYSDNRHPDNVNFTKNLDEDLIRRDFTVNAMAYNEQRGLVDNHNGVKDLKDGMIRCVGDADARFNEDALRIMRAIRFASEYGFKIEENTSKAIRNNYKLLENVSMERISAELNKMIVGKAAGKLLVQYKEVFGYIIPELVPSFGMNQDNPHHDKNVWEHICAVVDNCEPMLDLRLASLFHDIGKPYCKTIDQKGIGHFYGHAEKSVLLSNEIMHRLRQPNDLACRVSTLVKYHDRLGDIGEKGIRRLYGKLGSDMMQKLVIISYADIMGQSKHNRKKKLENFEKVKSIIDKIEEDNLCCKDSQLEINGNDIIGLGILPGKIIGEILDDLLENVISGELKNEKEELMEYVRRKYNAHTKL